MVKGLVLASSKDPIGPKNRASEMQDTDSKGRRTKGNH